MSPTNSERERRTSLCRPFAVVILALVALFPFLFFGHFAGDAEIHLVYARNAAEGAFFEFNRGEKTAGVTSPGYMLMLAALFLAMPERFVPVAVKGLDYFAWYAMLYITYLLAHEVLGPGLRARVTAVVAGLVPGSVYNSAVGMESPVFGLLVVVWCLLAARWRWLEGHAPGSGLKQVLLVLLLGASCWIRPEGFVIMAVGFTVRWWAESYARGRWAPSRPTVLQLL